MLSTPLPRTGDVVRVRRRTWLVNEVHPGTGRDFARVQLSCLDADSAGDPLEVLWQLELSTEIVPERPKLLGNVDESVWEDDDINELRRLRDAMDRAVLAAYGWSDLEPTDKDAIIRRLRKLNAERAAEEAAAAKGKAK